MRQPNASIPGARLRFTGTDGSAVHAPLLEAEIGGVATLLVLDTGSDTHLLTVELAAEAGLATEMGEEGTDHAGASMASGSAGTVPMQVGDETIPLVSVVVIPAPPPFPAKGIGGILSPQLLHPDAWLVMDMAADELAFLQVDEPAVWQWMADRHPDFHLVAMDRIEDGTTVVSAAIEPHPAIPTLVNTGGRGTEFARSGLSDRGPGTEERIGGGVSGADVMAERLGAAVLAVGGIRVPVPDLAARGEMDGVQGMIGMDLLRGTVLACTGGTTGRLLWGLPADRLL